jgi:hypothetical protein
MIVQAEFGQLVKSRPVGLKKKQKSNLILKLWNVEGVPCFLGIVLPTKQVTRVPTPVNLGQLGSASWSEYIASWSQKSGQLVK